MKKRKRLKDLLRNKLSKHELDLVPRSFDLIGNMVVIQIPFELEGKKKLIAQTLLENHKNIESVYQRGKFKGRLRKQEVQFLAGKKQENVFYRENGCSFKFNIKTCYFSPRLNSDRLEIANKIKSKEKVLVLFGGVAPYAIVIAKNSKAGEVLSVEISKEASKYAEENVKLNKLENVKIIQGDVKKEIPKLREKFDRILMTRAQLKETFLADVHKIAKKGTIIHFYDFVFEEDYPNLSLERIKRVFKKVKILDKKKVREIGTRKYHVRIDFKII